MIDPMMSTWDREFEPANVDPCYHRCNERTCVCNMWIASCSECKEPIFGGDTYSEEEHGVRPYTYKTFTCEECMEAA